MLEKNFKSSCSHLDEVHWHLSSVLSMVLFSQNCCYLEKAISMTLAETTVIRINFREETVLIAS